jgi:AbrB family looped-hinge helix DNA binding protein
VGKVTSKLQVTIPKVIAERYGIRPGDEIEWTPAGDTLRVLTARSPAPSVSVQERLRLFDEATKRQVRRQAGKSAGASERGWRREELYDRGRTR